MSLEPRRTTVRYRLFVYPELGRGLGNTVHVGVDVEDADQMAPLVFEGLPRRVEQIRDALAGVRAYDHFLFGRPTRTSARYLRSVMRRLERLAPELVAGAEILERAGSDLDAE
jgi:hypothetical protein